ncbi:MAG: response regulator [Methylococcaceae bacterium]|nr:response regulator [Methylococcaceae bacterium]
MHRLPIKTKLVLMIVLIAVAALLIQAGSFVAFERMRIQQEMVRDLSSLARIIADRSTAALAFGDEQMALETLSALRIKRSVTAACIYDGSGKVFARYDSGEERPFAFPPGSPASAALWEGNYLHLTEPVLVDGAPTGAVFIRAGSHELDLLWQNYLLFAGLIAFGTSLMALLAAARWQRVISRPMEDLTEIARTISVAKDYSIRATPRSDDELGVLVRAFNGMLETIEQRDEELQRANRLLAQREDQLRQANEALEVGIADRTAELQALFDSASVGIVLLKDRVIVRCNRRMDEMFGYAPGEQVGQPTRIYYADEESWAIAGREIYKAIWSGDTTVREQIMVRKDRSAFLARVASRAVDVANPGRGMVAVVEDITDERAALEEIQQARALAEEATRMKSQFLANMSHEIRTPMNAILGMLYLALKSDPPPVLRNHLSKAQNAAHSLLGIINDVLDFSKIEAGKLEVERVEFGLDGVLEQLTDALGLQAEHKGVEFLIRYDVGIPPVLIGDPLRLGQVLINLCGNALKFTEHGEVELSFRSLNSDDSGVTLQVSIRDTGIGMTADTQGRLFEKFTQADQSTTRRFGGTGLGLAICKHLVELMGGRIWVEDSQPGRGTTICFTARFEIARHAQARRRELLEQAGPLLEGIRVLVVDDNEVAREILAEMLRYLHLDVSLAANGPAALSLLEAPGGEPYDLVLMDWRMPGMTGDEATRRISGSPAISRRPKVILVTAYGREDVIRLAEQAGVNGVLIKPVTPSTLLDTILSVLGRGRVLEANGRKGIEPVADSADCAGARLLLVEDNDINREFAVELLLSMNAEVDQATTGEEAVAAVQREHYDAVLMDIQMPVLDGLEAARQIRELGRHPGNEWLAVMPIIAMTALAMAADAEKSRAAGMNDHVTKPIDPQRLAATLARWLKIAPRRAALDRVAEPPPAAPAPALPELASLNVAEGIRRIGGRADAYRRQLERFATHYRGAVAELQRQVSEHGPASAESYCHTLKGVTGNLGAQAFYQALAALDIRLKQGLEPDSDHWELLEEKLRELLEDIDGLAKESVDRPADANGAPASSLRLQELAAVLADALHNDLGAAEAALKALRAGVAGGPRAEAVATIAALVDKFEIDRALEALERLQLTLSQPND